MTRRVLGVALAAASLAMIGAAAGTAQNAAPVLPDCPAGTPAPAPPVVTVTGSSRSASRLVAGRPIEVQYDDPALVVAVQETIGPPGTTFDGDAGGSSATMTLPAAGAIPVTAKYYDVRNGTCVHGLTYTLTVDAGDLVPAGVGATREFSPRGGFEMRRLPRAGDYDGGPVTVGLVLPCDGAKAVVPLSVALHQERNLRRRPSASSPTVRLDVPDPCDTPTRVVASLPGVRLFYVNTSRADEGERFLVAQILTKGPRRFWVEFAQGARRLGSLRFYTAWKPQNGGFPKGWVVAPEAAFERARCRRPPSDTPLGFRDWPFPPCVRK